MNPPKHTEENISILVELGLSKSQAKVILSLADTKSLTVQKIAERSGISRPDVYRIIADLEAEGLIQRVISHPQEFHAVPLDEWVSRLMQKRIKRTAELAKKTLVLTQNLKNSFCPDSMAEGCQFVLIPAKNAVYVKAEKMIKNSRESICFLGLTKRMYSWLSNYQPALEEALARGVVCRTIMPRPDNFNAIMDQFKALSKYPNFALKFYFGSSKAGFSVWDKKEILVSTSSLDTPFPFPTLWSNNKCMVDIAQDYFDCLWDKAEQVNFSEYDLLMSGE